MITSSHNCLNSFICEYFNCTSGIYIIQNVDQRADALSVLHDHAALFRVFRLNFVNVVVQLLEISFSSRVIDEHFELHLVVLDLERGFEHEQLHIEPRQLVE